MRRPRKNDTPRFVYPKVWMEAVDKLLEIRGPVYDPYKYHRKPALFLKKVAELISKKLEALESDALSGSMIPYTAEDHSIQLAPQPPELGESSWRAAGPFQPQNINNIVQISHHYHNYDNNHRYAERLKQGPEVASSSKRQPVVEEYDDSDSGDEYDPSDRRYETSNIYSTHGITQVPNPDVKVYIVYYSMYGHVRTLAKKVKEGVDSVEGVEGFLYQVPETLTHEALRKMGAPPKDYSIPTIKPAQLRQADAFLFGTPARFGMMAAQMKAFFDATGDLWKTQDLAGRPAVVFVCTSSQGGGQETTALTTITQLTHHGMLYVPIGYTFGGKMFRMD